MNTENSSSPAKTQPAYENVGFTGKAGEYFGIWISNMVLSIITLGIYSAWAKVRRINYFYNHTQVRNFPFGYHATGKQLLIGRIIAVAVLIFIQIVLTFAPAFGFGVFGVFVFIYPWLIQKSIRFHARMTSWRNVRFNWHGTYPKSFLFFVVCPAVGMFSFGLLLPLMSRYTYEYHTSNFSFGTTKFNAETRTSQYYLAFLVALLVSLFLFLIPFFLIAFGTNLDINNLEDSDYLEEFVALSWLLAVFYIVSFISVLTVYKAMCRNIILHALKLGDVVVFDSRLSPVKFIWIQLTNTFAIVCSLGLLLPWASVRLYRYLSSVTAYQFIGDENLFVDNEREKMSAFGEEFADIEGMEVGIL